MTVALIHLPLMLAELPLKTYDANFHIFFASHYVHHWFNPWNPKWFAGFSQTTYPPLAQQWVAVLSWILGLNMAYMAVQFAAMLLLTVGVYRFSALWVSPRAASYAAFASALLASESFLVYNAGQLGTTCAAPIYLLALPYAYEWLREGGWRPFVKATALFTAAAAAHHATLIFASMFFAVPVIALAIMDGGATKSAAKSVGVRAAMMLAVVTAAAVVVLLPFWIALFRYPVTQTPIPHPSRANYILSPHWGLTYFVIPYGALILFLPFVILLGSKVTRLRPLMLGFWVCALVGLGGTTPVGRWLLGRAFDVITFERFAYWATLLALPIVGALAVDLVDRFRRPAAISLGLLAALSCGFAVAWTSYHPVDEAFFSVEPVAQWLNRDGHDNYRYITLGFSNEISRLAIETDATSVDGDLNSSRMLPELTKYSGAALTDAKFYGEGGLDSLRAMLHHANRYGLRWVVVADPYYDPLLQFGGWRRVDSLESGAITIWGKEGVPPARPLNSTQKPALWEGILWGILPFGSSLVAIAVLFVLPGTRRRSLDEDQVGTPLEDEDVSPPRRLAS